MPVKIDPSTGERIQTAASAVRIDPNTGERVTSPAHTQPATSPSMLEQAMHQGGQFLQGIGKGAMSTLSPVLGGISYGVQRGAKALGVPPNLLGTVPSSLKESTSSVRQEAVPTNTAQSLGRGAEQIAEFVIPGGAEEAGAAKLASLAPKLGKAAKPLARIATGAVSSGAVNAAQGGSPFTGALMGAGGQVVGQGLKAAAPVVAEAALGIPKAARAFGKTPGAAIINETRGIRPETIAESAQERLGQLNPELERAASASPAFASLKPARQTISDAMNKASQQNAEGLHGQLANMGLFLSRDFGTGALIPENIPPRRLLDLKRGLSEEHLRWNPEIHNRALATGRQAYGALDAELDRTVPQAAGLNQRISSLIPVAQRAESVGRNAPTVQRALGRFGAHTGALTLGGIGAYEGRREGGLPGMVAGGITGVLAPELIASPEGQMALARTLNLAPHAVPAATGAALQFTRKKEEK